MDIQTELRQALTQYLESGRTEELLSVIDAHPMPLASPDGRYPDFHRILDFQIAGMHYRVCRSIADGESLTLSTVESSSSEPGVPLWLEGRKLREWAESEREEPSQEPIAWDRFR